MQCTLNPRTQRPNDVEHVTLDSYGCDMRRISEFYGITILMFFGDHNPPHFHARYAGRSARVALDETVLDGQFPRRATRLVKEWAMIHGDELDDCWDRVVNHQPPGTNEPLP